MIKNIMLSLIICVSFFLVLFVVLAFFDNGKLFFISKKKRRILFDEINSDNIIAEKYNTLILFFQKRGKNDKKKLHQFLLKETTNKNIDLFKLNELIKYSDSVLLKNSKVDYLLNEIYTELNHNDVNQALILLNNLKNQLIEDRRERGFEDWYGKIMSVFLAILTIISFIYSFC